MTTQSVAGLLPHAELYADRTVSTVTANFVHGIEPLITELIAMGEGRTEAYLARETIAAATGLCHSDVIGTHYPRQLAEAGIVTMTSHGRFGMVRRKDGTLRGVACGYAVDWDGWTPGDLPELELETEPYFIDTDHNAVAAAMSPVAHTWAKYGRAHHLAMALLHHAGLARVRMTPELAAEILGKSRITGYRALRDLVELGLAAKGGGHYWVDLSPLFYDASLNRAHPDVEKQREETRLLRTSVFTEAGWAVRSMARIARETLAMLQGLSGSIRPVLSRYTAAVGRSLRSSVLFHMRERRDDPGSSGIGLVDF